MVRDGAEAEAPAERVHALFREYGAFVHRVIRRLGVPERVVDDLTQDTFVVAFQQIERFNGDSPKGWLYQIARRVVSAHQRRHSSFREVLSPSGKLAEGAEDKSSEDAVWDLQMRSVLDEALLSLSLVEREIFLLHELEGMSMRETVELIPCPLQTGYSRLQSAHRKMRRQLENAKIREEIKR